jgi:hypothetical protein
MRSVILILIVLCLTPPIHAQLTESDQQKFVTQLHTLLPLSDMIKRVSDGRIEKDKIRAVATILRNTNELHIHQMRGANGNEVLINPDGHSEAVYDRNKKAVKDGINDGSYNYFHPQQDALRHFSFDIAPWLLMGQSPNDPTTRAERIDAYSADVFDGVIRVCKVKPRQRKLADVTVKELGSAEAVAIFLMAIDRGKADDLLLAVSSQKEKTPDELRPLVEKFQRGLLILMAADKDQNQ